MRASGAKVLGAQIVLPLTGDFTLDCHYLRSKWIVIVSLVQFRQLLQIYLEDETLLVLLVFPMIK